MTKHKLKFLGNLRSADDAPPTGKKKDDEDDSAARALEFWSSGVLDGRRQRQTPNFVPAGRCI
jgi:hypothetical protein